MTVPLSSVTLGAAGSRALGLLAAVGPGPVSPGSDRSLLKSGGVSERRGAYTNCPVRLLITWSDAPLRSQFITERLCCWPLSKTSASGLWCGSRTVEFGAMFSCRFSSKAMPKPCSFSYGKTKQVTWVPALRQLPPPLSLNRICSSWKRWLGVGSLVL